MALWAWYYSLELFNERNYWGAGWVFFGAFFLLGLDYPVQRLLRAEEQRTKREGEQLDLLRSIDAKLEMLQGSQNLSEGNYEVRYGSGQIPGRYTVDQVRALIQERDLDVHELEARNAGSVTWRPVAEIIERG